MFKKFLSLITLLAVVSCSSSPVNVEKIRFFDLSNYQTFGVKVFAPSDDVKVSPFTVQAFEKEFNEQMMNLGLNQSPESQITVKVSLSVEEDSKRSNFRYRNSYYSNYLYDDYDDVDRMFLRVSIFETATEEPLWTGVRQAKYVNDSLVLSSEEISKYVNSFLNEIISS